MPEIGIALREWVNRSRKSLRALAERPLALRPGVTVESSPHVGCRVSDSSAKVWWHHPCSWGGMRLLLLAAIALLTSASTGCAVEADAEDTEEASDALKDVVRFKVITHNIAGGMLNDGQPKALAKVIDEIAADKPDVVMLSEVCTTQSDAFKARYPGWDVHYTVTRPNHPNCGPLGNLVASPRPLTNVAVVDLGEPEPNGSKVYTMICGNVSMPGRKGDVRACSTHLLSKGDDAEANLARRGRQVERVVASLKDRVQRGEAAVVAGDFNAGPWRPILDPIYRLRRDGTFGGGAFDEADQTDPAREKRKEHGVVCGASACRSGENTHDESKLDHVFFSHNRIAGEIGADVRGRGNSDHDLYRAFADLRMKKEKK